MEFSKSLKLNHLFRRLYRKGQSAANGYLVLYCRRNGSQTNRIGLTVSAKLGHAVVRNKLRRRLREIYAIVQKHHFLKGFSPEEFRAMLEDLGPSFVKIGQTLSTRSEILPKAYCDELAKLQTECDPLPFEQILAALDEIYGDARGDVFDAIDPTPLGSASLAQVHKARLATGETVAVKIQRPGVKATMAQDIDIMRMVARQMLITG